MKYSILCKVYEELENHPSRLEKTQILADFLNQIKSEKNAEIIYLLQGRIFPDYDEREIGISTQLIIKALAKATGVSSSEIIRYWKKLGDLGLVAEEVTKKKKQSTLSFRDLNIDKVIQNLQKLPALTGKGTVDKKLALVSELFTSANPQEAKYLTRTILNDLRIGIGAGTIRDAIVWACFNVGNRNNNPQIAIPEHHKNFSGNFSDKDDKNNYDIVQEAYDKVTDWKLVFEKACKGANALEEISLEPGKPVRVMLFLKEDNIEKGFEKVGKPALIDYKYDGFRMLINKNESGEIKIFTRRLDNVTRQFPEVVEYAKKYIEASSFIIDSEAVGYNPKTGRYLPFQNISQRIKRKYDIEKTAKQLPVEVNVFDILYCEGKSLLKTPLKERREIIEKILKKHKLKIRPSEAIITEDISKAEEFYKKALEEGEEGVMMKNLDSPYQPGARVGFGVKVKPEGKEFDLVIVDAEYGTGKRAGWLTSYTVACQNDVKFLEIGKVSTGLKEKEEEGLSFKELTRQLKQIAEKEEGRIVKVKPKIVVVVAYQNIQKSPTYNSGYALRFPRIIRLRPDRSASDIASLDEIEREYRKGEN